MTSLAIGWLAWRRSFRCRFCVALYCSCLSAAGTAHAEPGCNIKDLLELPVDMRGLSPFISAQINGHEAVMLLDSGAFYSSIMSEAAAKFGLKTYPAPFSFIEGAGPGSRAPVEAARADEFKLGTATLKKVEFLVNKGALLGNIAGILGLNLLRSMDVDYDLASGTVRFMQPVGCDNTSLAYWKSANAPSAIPMDRAQDTRGNHYIVSVASLNGVTLRVMFDTGSAYSLLSQDAARRAGVEPGGRNVTSAGILGGVGSTRIETWTGPFDQFSIGNEEITHTRLRFGKFSDLNMDMILGADFFLSHRVYVANSQHKIYFTYNGGRVFNLQVYSIPEPSTSTPDADAALNLTPTDPVAPLNSATPPVVGDDQALTADDFSRRGRASAARHEFDHAIADLTRAIVLDPTQATYLNERALIYQRAYRDDLALADFDASLKLKPDDTDVLLARANLRVRVGDQAGATADLEAISNAAPRDADVHLWVAETYSNMNLLAAAGPEYDLWIPAHKADRRLGMALNGRAWIRALLNEQLGEALEDCNAALRLAPHSRQYLDTRGMVRLRQGDYKDSLVDYNQAIAIGPGAAWSFYGRGIDKIRLGKVPEGQADIEAATKLYADIAKEAAKYGIAP
jgi:tetratricopeptide (TPR) repeat protein/predicted aspartyl protease